MTCIFVYQVLVFNNSRAIIKVSGIQIPPDNCRSFLPLDSSYTNQGHLSPHSFQNSPEGIDCNLSNPHDDHNLLGDTIPIIPFLRNLATSPGRKICSYDDLSSLSQQPCGEISSISENLSSYQKQHY